MQLKTLLIIFLILPLYPKAQESILEKEKRMQWFKDAKLGIFIHWGIYAVNGIDESWSFFNGYIDVPEKVLDKEVTVIAVLLDGKVDLYREKGQVIESN